MGKNLAFRIKVEIVETGAAPSLDRCPQEHEDGSFNRVVPESDELNISALREVLGRYLTEAGKKTPSASGAPEVRADAASAGERVPCGRGNRTITLFAWS